MRAVFVKSRNPFILTHKNKLKRYFVEEQGWDEEEVNEMSLDELEDAWEHFHEY